MNLEKEKQDSIKVTKGMTGKYSFEVKIYFDNKEDKDLEVIDKIECAVQSLTDKFNKEQK